MRLFSLLFAGIALAALAGCNASPKNPALAPQPGPSPARESPAPLAPQVTSRSENNAVADAAAGQVAQDLQQHALELARRFLILDGHIDAPYRLEHSRDPGGQLTDDLGGRSHEGQFDYERAKAGGLDVAFMSIYVPSKYENHGAKKFANTLIDLVVGVTQRFPDQFAIARSPSEVRDNAGHDKISLALGMENGAPLEHRLANVAYFHERGVRYITLTHFKDNHIADSSSDERHTHHGLSAFGKQVVHEMNRVGILIDVSHISDDAFWQVIAESRVPVIASHSSCRHFTPGFARNMSDEMITRLGQAGGVIQINFGSGFLDEQLRKAQEARQAELGRELERRKLDPSDKRADPIRRAFLAEHPLPHARVERVADHIEYAVRLAGIDHVGLGSDFDGVGDTLPEGLSDVSEYPNLIRVLLERGFTDAQIEAICSANVLRVWQSAEDFAKAATRAAAASAPRRG